MNDLKRLEAVVISSELRDHIPGGVVRVIKGVMHEDQPWASWFGDYPATDINAALLAIRRDDMTGALYHVYDDMGGFVHGVHLA